MMTASDYPPIKMPWVKEIDRVGNLQEKILMSPLLTADFPMYYISRKPHNMIPFCTGNMTLTLTFPDHATSPICLNSPQFSPYRSNILFRSLLAHLARAHHLTVLNLPAESPPKIILKALETIFNASKPACFQATT